MSNQIGQIWDDNHVQFSRLLAEISAVADLTVEQIDAVAESMDLDSSEVHTLFVRAEHEFEALKEKQLNSKGKDVNVKQMKVNGFVVKANTDSDDHLTLTVEHEDKSKIQPMDWDAFDEDHEWGERFTTSKIEDDYNQSQQS